MPMISEEVSMFILSNDFCVLILWDVISVFSYQILLVCLFCDLLLVGLCYQILFMCLFILWDIVSLLTLNDIVIIVMLSYTISVIMQIITDATVNMIVRINVIYLC